MARRKTTEIQRAKKLFGSHHQSEGFRLQAVKKIRLPIWECHQSIVVETSVRQDQFSLILLNLIRNHFQTHEEICRFLGLKQDSFVTVQFYHLLRHRLIVEPKDGVYELTQQGRDFLAGRAVIPKLEVVPLLFYMTNIFSSSSRREYTFFDIRRAFDVDLSAGKSTEFTGYQPHRKLIGSKSHVLQIRDEYKPAYRVLQDCLPKFVEHVSELGHQFFDFADLRFKVYPRQLEFVGLRYINDDQEIRIDVRRSENSTQASSKFELERRLSDFLTLSEQQEETPLDWSVP